ncbi:hypothetical protein [Bacillus sp. SM2101]|uniref:hypothetical protein n=1 Tax=Bacillus sp. SM2101 TaxID=2805366 RepID=UPI001BDF165D|nr:hypothetical protein [Bacillus sp. SM2101]
MKLSKKVLAVTIFSLFALILPLVVMPSTTSAYVGEQIIDTPQPDWSRYDDTDGYITYEGDGFWMQHHNLPFGGSYNTTAVAGDKIKFNFTGTKLRLLATYDHFEYTHNSTVYVDGIPYPINQNGYLGMNQVVFLSC